MPELYMALPFHIERAIDSTVREFAESKRISWRRNDLPIWFVCRDFRVSTNKRVHQRLQVAVFNEFSLRNFPILSIVPDVNSFKVDAEGSYSGGFEDVFDFESRCSLIRHISIYDDNGYSFGHDEVSSGLKTNLDESWKIVSKIRGKKSALALCAALSTRD